MMMTMPVPHPPPTRPRFRSAASARPGLMQGARAATGFLFSFGGYSVGPSRRPAPPEAPARPTAPCTDAGAPRLLPRPMPLTLPLLLPALMLVLLLMPQEVEAQRLNFSLFADGVTAFAVQNELNFNRGNTIPIATRTPDPIVLDINQTSDREWIAVLSFEVQSEFDVVIEVQPPIGNTLKLDGTSTDPGETIDFQLRWAYSNSGAITDTEAFSNFREVPAHINFARIPALRRATSISEDGPPRPPGPPPTPGFGGLSRDKSLVYIFIYGTIDASSTEQVGDYSETVTVIVSYADIEVTP